MFSPSITMGPHIHTPEFLQTVGPTITSQRPGNLKHQPSQQYSRRKYAVPQWTWYTIHPQSSWNFRWKIPFLHDIWWPLVGFDFLPPKRPWSTGHPLRRSIELSPTDREKNILGEGTSYWVMALGESESHFDLKSHWNVCLDSNTTNSQDPEDSLLCMSYICNSAS